MNTNTSTAPEQDDNTDLPIYARVFPDLETRIGRSTLYHILDPHNTGDIDPAFVKLIELAGSLDLNIALLCPKGDGVIVLEGFAEGMARLIAIDTMVVHCARQRPDLMGMDQAIIDGLENACRQRVAMLVANSGKLPVAAKDDVAAGGWCIVELMGQKRLSAWVTKAQFGGQTMLRLEIPIDSSKPKERAIKYIGSQKAVYAITPCDERIALALADKNAVLPVSSWELRDATPASPPVRDGNVLGPMTDRNADEDDDDEWEPPSEELDQPTNPESGGGDGVGGGQGTSGNSIDF